jgi:hypothetical protein
MFMISDAEIAAIHGALEQGGESGATAEALRRWPGLTAKQALDCVRTIASWKPRAAPQED